MLEIGPENRVKFKLLRVACLAVLLTLLAVSVALAQPPVPHDVEEDGVSFEDCVACHRTGEDGAPLLAVDHAGHENGDCRVCHGTPGMVDAPAVTHPLAGWGDCLGCHEAWDGEMVEIANLADSDYDHAIYENGTCVSCHPPATEVAADLPRVSCGVCHPETAAAETLHNGPETWVRCVDCHQAAAGYPHDPDTILSRDADCLSCHLERQGHWTSALPEERFSLAEHVSEGDPHARVDCAACHLREATVALDPETGRLGVVLPGTEEGVPPDDPARMDIVPDVDCQRCHAPVDGVAAPEAELPPRSVLCMACHDASPVVDDGLSWAGLGLFGLGMVVTASVWLQGSVRGRRRSLPGRVWDAFVGFLDLVTTPRLFHLIWGFVVDGLLHRQLFRRSRMRWLAHAFMYLGMTARLALGLFTWLMTVVAPAAALTATLADKNAPAVALTYEVLGLLVVVGAVMVVVRRYVVKDDQLITGTQDTVAVALLGAIFSLGFVVEGLRILATDLRPGLAAFSFVGYAISLALGWLPVDWGAVYPWLWYVHAGLVALFVAYLPFSKFLHVLIGPVVAALNAALDTEVA